MVLLAASAVSMVVVIATFGALAWAVVLGSRRPEMRRWSAVLALAALAYPWSLAMPLLLTHLIFNTSHPLIGRPHGMSVGMWIASVSYFVTPIRALPLLAALALGLRTLRVPPSAPPHRLAETPVPAAARSGAGERPAGPLTATGHV